MIAFSNLPSGVIILVFMGGAAAVAAFLPLLGARLLRQRPDPGLWGQTAHEALKLVGPLTAVFLSFALVQSMRELRAAETAAQREAANIEQLDRALATLAGVDAEPARLRLRAYAHALVEDEWPAMHDERRESERAAAALVAPGAEVEQLELALARARGGGGQVTKDFDDLQDDRVQRVQAINGTLPTEVWWVTTGLFACLLTAIAFLPPVPAWRAMGALYAAAIALLISCFYLTDGAYQGRVSVSPAPLASAIHVLDNRSPVLGPRP
jgi:hypothetical protein